MFSGSLSSRHVFLKKKSLKSAGEIYLFCCCLCLFLYPTFSPAMPRPPVSPKGPDWPLKPSGPSSPRGPVTPLSPYRQDWRVKCKCFNLVCTFSHSVCCTEASDLRFSPCPPWYPCRLWTQGSHLHPVMDLKKKEKDQCDVTCSEKKTFQFSGAGQSFRLTFSPLFPFRPLTPSAPWVRKITQATTQKQFNSKNWRDCNETSAVPLCISGNKPSIAKRCKDLCEPIDFHLT